MVTKSTAPRVSLRVKVSLLIIAIVTAAMIIQSVIMARAGTEPVDRWLTALYTILAVIVLSFIGVRMGRGFFKRHEKLLDVTRAWLRGNLGVRIDDTKSDDLGTLAENLDQLAEHLEEDEEDLSRLSQSNTRLTDQVRALAVVEERNRLARELHDSVKQHLFSLAMTASAISTRFAEMESMPDDVKEMVDEIVSASQNAQRETTRLIEDLRPGSLEERGLEAALNDYTLLFGAQEHLLIYLDVHCNDKLLNPPVAEALYRVAQESLHNVARHAHATRVDVVLQCIDDRVMLKIEDNGVGFETHRVRQGMGFGNMHERLLGVGGRLMIESQPSIGTTVTAEVQLKGEPQPPAPEEAEGKVTAQFSHWSWLGQKLVIPVGQTWPWLPDEEERHLTRPLLGPETAPLFIRKERNIFALRQRFTLRNEVQRHPICTIIRERTGYTWEMNNATWDVQHMRGLYGRSLLKRNGQPLAAYQYQGRQMNTWTEIVYQTQTYNLVYGKENTNIYKLLDGMGCEYAEMDKVSMTVQIYHEIPFQLLMMMVVRVLDEISVSAFSQVDVKSSL